MKGVIGVVLLNLNLNNLDQFIMSLKRQNIKKFDIFFYQDEKGNCRQTLGLNINRSLKK